MKVYPARSTFPSILFEDILEKMADAFDVDITCSIYGSKYSAPQVIEI
jgi:hypothetical protein